MILHKSNTAHAMIYAWLNLIIRTQLGVHKETKTKLKDPIRRAFSELILNQTQTSEKVSPSKTDLYKNGSADSTETSGTFTEVVIRPRKKRTLQLFQSNEKMKLQKLSRYSIVSIYTEYYWNKRFSPHRVAKILLKMVNNFKNCYW